MDKKQVSILILNYRCAEDTIACCISLLENIKYPSYKIIILDNNSQDDSCIKIESFISSSGYNNISMIENKTNYGYAHGNNVGIRSAIDAGSEYICIVNPDIMAVDDFLTELVCLMERDESIGMAAPAICGSYDLSTCDCCGVKLGVITGYSKMLNSRRAFSNIRPMVYSCDYLGGMCLLIRVDVIKKIGMIPENYFLFYEETEWCIKCKNAGYSCIADANTKVIHKGSVSIDQESTGIINLHNYYIYRNRIIFQRRNRSIFVYSLFLVYYLLEIIYEVIVGHYSKEALMAYFDGVTNRDRLNKVKQD